jgi:prepilin-type N-terminal cleavage/methylation domain-containing protein
MNSRIKGFTLIEMLIVIAIFGFVLAGTSQMVISILTVHRQQSRIAESNIEGIIGLELLRKDIGKAGYGLPWNGLINYNEAAISTGNAAVLNDAPNPPRGIVSINDGGWNGTDYLAIKAANVAMNAACSKWTFLTSYATATTTSWSPSTENLRETDRVIVLMPGSLNTEVNARTLTVSGGNFFKQFNSISDLASSMTLSSTGIAYGIDSDTDLRMPFNRADYYVKQPTTGIPQRCAIGTGILYKAVVNQSDGNLTEMPLLDCVADMQVIYRYDTGTGVLQVTNDIQDATTWTPQIIRDQVKEVRVYILAQEGQKDTNFTYPTNTVYVGGDTTVGNSLGRSFNFAGAGIANWQNYRWKIYTLVVKMDNLI